MNHRYFTSACSIGFLALLACLSAAGCFGRNSPEVGGNSNWLTMCEKKSDCGDDSACICGTCTVACEKKSDCTELNSAAVCTDTAEWVPQCEGKSPKQAAVCTLSCGMDRDCTSVLGKGFECALNTCVQKPQATAIDASMGMPDGSLAMPDGSLAMPDGSLAMPVDSSIVEPEPVDGDGVCESSESPETAPLDCAVTGDGLCTGNENPWSDSGDCKGPKLLGNQGPISISADGSRLAFQSRDSLVAEDGDTAADIYVRDYAQGITILATPHLPNRANRGGIYLVAISDDGKWVVTSAGGVVTHLVEGDTNNTSDVYVTNLDTGELQRASLQLDGIQFATDCTSNGMTRDSRYVHYACGGAAFTYDVTTGDRAADTGMDFGAFTDAEGLVEVYTETNAVLPDDTNNSDDIYLRVRMTDEVERMSVRADGIEANGDSSNPEISRDGRFVAFVSFANNLTTDPNTIKDPFVRDRFSGDIIRLTVREDGSGIKHNNQISSFHISGNGRFVTFILLNDAYLYNIGDWVDSLPSM